MKKVELLAPAGDMDSLVAAVQNGADAVYLGGNKFSARAYASNFDNITIINAVKYCHYYGVKVYITINTIIKENEMQEALEYAAFLYSIGVDAVIVQDPGLIYNINKLIPGLELHASTQMTVHNEEGALLLYKSGLKRIVLSRELALGEVESIAKNLNIETEIFIHGALCVCYSGQCLLSSIIGGRSGNRGRCAQPCRLPYTLKDYNSGTERSGYLLSTRDICTIDNIKPVIESGAASLKIEGRMKRPEYVAGVVYIYRKIIDLYYNNKLDKNFDFNEEYNNLLQLFNREGFSKSYLFGNQGKNMMAYNFPKNSGIMLGKVEKDLTIRLKTAINLKDGVRNGDEGFSVSKIINKQGEAKTGEYGDIVQLYPIRYKAGDILYKTLDNRLMDRLRESYKNKYGKKIAINLQVSFTAGAPLKLVCDYSNKRFEYEGDIIEKAVKAPVSKEKLIQSLSKSGEEPFRFTEIEFNIFEEGYISVASINEARRSFMEGIKNHIDRLHYKSYIVPNVILNLQQNDTKAECNRFIATYIDKKYEKNYIDIDLKRTFSVINQHSNKINNGRAEKIIVCINSMEQYRAAKELNIDKIAVNPFYRIKDAVKLDEISAPFILKVPNILRKEINQVCSIIDKNIDRISGLVTSNYGIIYRYGSSLPVWGDYKLNIINSYGMDFFRDYLKGTCLSIELNKKETWDVLKHVGRQYQLLVYGKAELMVSEYCPIGCAFGGNDERKNCRNRCENGQFALTDRMNEEFTVLTDKFCRSYIFNSKPTNLLTEVSELEKLNLEYRFDFIDEDYEETKEILTSYLQDKWSRSFSNYTRGHYKRGVE